MAHKLIFLTFDGETKHFAHKMLTLLNLCRLTHMSCNGNHRGSMLRIDPILIVVTAVNIHDCQHTHTHTQIHRQCFVHRHYAVQYDQTKMQGRKYEFTLQVDMVISIKR